METLKKDKEATKAQRKEIHKKYRDQMESILTPEQKQQFEKMKADKKEGRKNGEFKKRGRIRQKRRLWPRRPGKRIKSDPGPARPRRQNKIRFQVSICSAAEWPVAVWRPAQNKIQRTDESPASANEDRIDAGAGGKNEVAA